ncbi:MAG: hypothetical protein GY778_20185 [bacterium]|nr:hypothetical protein [bacterium]
MILNKTTKDGPVAVPLTNFTAKIVRQTVIDDGAETRTTLDITATLNGRTFSFTISAASYPGLTWVVENIGAGAVVHAGFSAKDHTRCAIQLLSAPVPRRQVFAHSGWRKIAGRWAYLHAGGAVGVSEPVEVELPEPLRHLELPDPPCGEDLCDAIRKSLGFLKLGPGRVTVPVLAGVYRAVLGGCDFSLHLSGPTGAFKSEEAALAQQHFGAGFDARHLPGSWTSTANANETLTHAAKDAVVVIDDFAPGGTSSDVARLHREADRLLRAAGNRQGRARLRSDCTMRPTRNPSCLIISTGEEVPRGQSLRARLVIVEIGKADIDVRVLTECQRNAAAGAYAAAMAGFVDWAAPRYEVLQRELPQRIAVLRDELSGTHRRTPTTIANLLFGLQLFIQFATEVGAVTADEASQLGDRGRAALVDVADAQADHLRSADPVRRFMDLIAGALASGRAHIADTDGTAPKEGNRWGWRLVTIGSEGKERDEWRPQGDRIGWIGEDDGALFLEPTAAYRTADHMAAGGETLAVSPRTLWARMAERRLLHVVDGQRHTVRRRLEGRRQRVLWLVRQPVSDAGTDMWTGPECGAVPDGAKNPRSRHQKRGPGPNGPVGPVMGVERELALAQPRDGATPGARTAEVSLPPIAVQPVQLGHNPPDTISNGDSSGPVRDSDRAERSRNRSTACNRDVEEF